LSKEYCLLIVFLARSCDFVEFYSLNIIEHLLIESFTESFSKLEHLLGMLVIKVKSLAPEAIVVIVAIPSFCMVCVLPVLGVFNAGPVEPNRVKKGWLGARWRLMVLIERG